MGRNDHGFSIGKAMGTFTSMITLVFRIGVKFVGVIQFHHGWVSVIASVAVIVNAVCRVAGDIVTQVNVTPI